MLELSPFAIMVLIGCGVCFAGSDFIRKAASAHCTPTLLTALVFTAISPIFMVLLFVSGAVTVTPAYVLPASLNILTNVLANIFLIRAVAVSDLSKTIPLLSLTPVLTALLGWGFLEEVLGAGQWLGIVLVVAGVLWLYVPEEKGAGLMSVVRNFMQEQGAKHMCLVAVFWTLAPTFERVALRHASVPLHGFVHFTCAAIALWLWLWLRGGVSKASFPKASGWKIVGVLSLFYAGALGLQMLSLKLVYVGIMESVKRVIGQVSAVVLGRVVYKEPITKPKILGVIFMCAGVPLVILPGVF